MKIPVIMNVDMSELWGSVWGSDGAGSSYWCSEIRTIDQKPIDLWTKTLDPNPQDFSIYDYQEDQWHDISLHNLAQAYANALNDNAGHCGGHTLDIQDPDACFGDIVLQYAVFGEMIYG